MAIILVGKRNGFMNMLCVKSAEDVGFFPEEVQKCVRIMPSGINVDNTEYDCGENIPFGSFVVWETVDMAQLDDIQKKRVPNGFNLYNKSNAQSQINDGTIEVVNGKYRRTKVVPIEASILDGTFPECFRGVPAFDGQLTLENGVLSIETPWGRSSCAAGKGIAMKYGIYGPEEKDERFRGYLNGNILTRGTESFNNYYVVNEAGKILFPVEDLF